jgi:hypothetical protein
MGVLKLIFSAVILLAGVFGVSLHYFTANSDFERLRQISVFDFAASADFVVFPVALSSDTWGLIVLNRKTGEQKIIYDELRVLSAPFLSRDGQRLLFVRRRIKQESKELVSCMTANWHCETVLKIEGTIFSPVELDADTLLYSSSPFVTVEPENRRTTPFHNLFLLKKGSAPVRLTEFDAYQLNPISVAGHRVLFTAVHGYYDKKVIPPTVFGPTARSEIFSLELSVTDQKIIWPDLPLVPVFAIEGLSTNASIAADGGHVAFLNRRTKQGQTHFNLAVAKTTGEISRYIEAREFGFSRPAFVNRTIVANELLHDHYEVKEYELSGEGGRILFQIDHSVDALKKLPRLALTGID